MEYKSKSAVVLSKTSTGLILLIYNAGIEGAALIEPIELPDAEARHYCRGGQD